MRFRFIYVCTFGIVRKRHPQSGRGLSIADVFQTRGRGSSDADVRTVWCKKLQIFRNWCPQKQGRDVEPVRIRRRESIFRDFVRTPFMDGPFRQCMHILIVSSRGIIVTLSD